MMPPVQSVGTEVLQSVAQCSAASLYHGAIRKISLVAVNVKGKSSGSRSICLRRGSFAARLELSGFREKEIRFQNGCL
jgi:hypothetical protein